MEYMNTINDIWIFAEFSDGAIASSFYEILGKVRSLFRDDGSRPCITAVVLSSEEANGDEELSAGGADAIIHVTHEKLDDYNPAYYTAALAELIQEKKPDVVLTPASPIGAEVAPGLAVRLDTGLIAHAADLFINEEGQLIAMIPAFGGELMGEIFIPKKKPVMMSVTPGVFRRTGVPASAQVRREIFRPSSLDALDPGIQLIGKVPPETEEQPLESAEAVVCVGLGIRSRENLDKAQMLAKKLGAAFCYTRPVVDMGYMDSERDMVGSSGKTIRPKLYLGFGISGAAQHVCGMKDSGLIISVNLDEKADIFDVSNYKVVGDSGKLLDALLSTLEKES